MVEIDLAQALGFLSFGLGISTFYQCKETREMNKRKDYGSGGILADQMGVLKTG